MSSDSSKFIVYTHPLNPSGCGKFASTETFKSVHVKLLLGMTIQVQPDKMLFLFDRYFEVSDDVDELLKVGGLTERQIKAIRGLMDGKNMTELSMDICGSTNTQNAYDALNFGSGKILEALAVIKALSKCRAMLAKTFDWAAKRGSSADIKFDADWAEESA